MFERAKYKSSSELDWTKLPDPVASVKRDGGNFWLTIDSKGVPSYISRRESVKGGYPDRTESLPHLSFVAPELAGHIINVELVHTGATLHGKDQHSVVSGILNSLPPKAIQTQSMIGPVRASMFNVLNPSFKSFEAKLKYLKDVEKLIGKPHLIFAEPHVEGKKEIKDLIDSTKLRGLEGVIITSKTLPEPSNVRVKVKHQDTYNLKVVGMTEEVDITGKPKGTMGALILADAGGRQVGTVGTGFSRADRVDAFKNPSKWIDQIVQVKTMGFARNALRMPVYNGFADGQVDYISIN